MKKPETQEYLTTKEAAKYLSLASSTLEKHRSTGDGPKFKKLGRSIRYAKKDLDEWADSRTCNSTSDANYVSLRRGQK